MIERQRTTLKSDKNVNQRPASIVVLVVWVEIRTVKFRHSSSSDKRLPACSRLSIKGNSTTPDLRLLLDALEWKAVSSKGNSRRSSPSVVVLSVVL